MTFHLDGGALRRLCAAAAFAVPETGMVFAALRGTRPVEGGGTDFAPGHAIEERPLDHQHLHCTIVQWLPAQGLLAVFRGSSVPNREAVAEAMGANGVGTNKLASGWYGLMPGGSDYRYVKGHHGFDRHLAFRNESRLPVWRTADDLEYDGHDRFEVDQVVYDNLHCARTEDEDGAWFSSNGCVVVAGRPGLRLAANVDYERGGWRKFLLNANGLAQQRFPLAVFEPGESARAIEDSPVELLRFGSTGPRVAALQEALIAAGFDTGEVPDGSFGPATVKALHAFQRATFGPAGTDVLAGPQVAAALRLNALAPMPEAAFHTAGVVAEATAEAFEDTALDVAMDVTHAPLPGWRIIEDTPGRRWSVTWDAAAEPVALGSWFEYTHNSDNATRGPTRGLARTARTKPGLVFKPEDWAAFGDWPELIYPLAAGESSGSFTVVNCWDRAAITFGFTQLAAHTGDDLLPFFLQLADELPDDFWHWFPELEVRGGRLAFRRGARFRYLDLASKATDGGYTADYYHGQMMRFFNPDRYHRGGAAADLAELHATARWVVWTLQSEAMRKLQVAGAIRNFRQSLDRLHAAILAHPATAKKHPRGTEGMRCDVLSVAVAALHLGDTHRTMVLSALRSVDPSEAIRASGYGPGNRAETIHKAMKARPRLAGLIYDRAKGEPVLG